MVLLIGGLGGFLAGSIVLPLLIKTNFLGTAAIFNKLAFQAQTVVTKIEESPILIPQPNYFSDAIGKVESRVVAIQSFSGGTLVRSGSGIILTRDGIIGTLNSIVPSDAKIIQVIAGDKIYSGKIIFRNYNKNIAIISIAGSNFQAAGLKSELPALGQKLLVLAKTVGFGKSMPLVAEAIVSQADSNNEQFKINISYDQFLYGSAIIDNEASILGLLDFRNQKPLVITSELLADTLSAGLTPHPEN